MHACLCIIQIAWRFCLYGSEMTCMVIFLEPSIKFVVIIFSFWRTTEILVKLLSVETFLIFTHLICCTKLFAQNSHCLVFFFAKIFESQKSLLFHFLQKCFPLFDVSCKLAFRAKAHIFSTVSQNLSHFSSVGRHWR